MQTMHACWQDGDNSPLKLYFAARLGQNSVTDHYRPSAKVKVDLEVQRSYRHRGTHLNNSNSTRHDGRGCVCILCTSMSTTPYCNSWLKADTHYPCQKMHPYVRAACTGSAYRRLNWFPSLMSSDVTATFYPTKSAVTDVTAVDFVCHRVDCKPLWKINNLRNF